MDTRTRGPLIAGLALVFSGTLAHGEESFVLGPVERFSGRSITVLGQTYILAAKEVNATAFELGAFVLIAGETANVALSNVIATKSSFPRPYVPGASSVALSGVISKYEPRTGYLTINGLSVYIVNATWDAKVKLAAGERITVFGLQPLPGGTLIAAQVWHQDTQSSGVEHLYGIEGIGLSKQLIEGTGLITHSIEGTGVNKQAIEGTGFTRQAIEGTGVNKHAIEGTGFTK